MSVKSLLLSLSSFFFWPFRGAAPEAVPEPAPQVHLITWTWEAPAIALAPSEAELHELIAQLPRDGGVQVDTDGGMYRRFALPTAHLDGVAVGSAWRVLSEDGERRCTVTGLGLIVSEYSDWSTLGTEGGAPCAAPLVFADISCDREDMPMPHSSIAVPSANTRAQAGLSSGELVTTDAPEGALAAALRDDSIRALRARAAASAAEKGEPLLQEIVASPVRVGKQEVTLLSGRFYTGEGYDACGGEDVVVTWGGLLVDGVPVGLREVPGGSVSAVLDLDGDGALETLESAYGETHLRTATGEIVRSHAAEWCVCGC